MIFSYIPTGRRIGRSLLAFASILHYTSSLTVVTKEMNSISLFPVHIQREEFDDGRDLATFLWR